MINEKHCPFCKTSASKACLHLALAAEARDFVRCCVDRCQGQSQWRLICDQRHHLRHQAREWSPEQEDFMWLETAFCQTFLKHLTWFGGMDYEWRSGPKLEQGGFWVLLWSKDPQRLWWELRDEFERKASRLPPPLPDNSSSSWLIWLTPR